MHHEHSMKFIRNSKLIGVKVDDDLVMMDADQGYYFSLNAVGASLWHLLETPKTTHELTTALKESYDVSEEQCQKDVLPFLEKMLSVKLIELV